MTTDLNGIWHFAIDQDPEYHRHEDYSRPVSLRHWEQVHVPGCWNRYADRYDFYEGVAWFVREFEVETLPPEQVAMLSFGGVNYIADVYLNGQHVGTHEGGYTAFVLDVSGAIRQGKNRLAVRVDNRHLKIRLPAVLGWYNYGGIHRDVSLTITPCVQIRNVRITARPTGDGADGSVSINTTPRDNTLTVAARICNAAGDCVWQAERDNRAEWALPFAFEKAYPWSPETPNLYTCTVEIRNGNTILDQHGCTFGIRSLGTSDQQILLNGVSTTLRGICYLYDHPLTGVAFDPQVVRRDLDDLHALGVNCLRSHFPVTDAFLDECDNRGMMLWLEVPIYCVAPPSEDTGSVFAEDSVQALALQMLREMVEQAANHPSVILWSVGNECNTDHPESLAFFKACVGQVRALDDTRLISYAALYGGVGCVTDLVDIIGINEYWGWYDRISFDGSTEGAAVLPIELPELEACLAEQSKLGKPLLLTEFGADAVPLYLSSSCELWSENYQAELLGTQFGVAARFPAVCGTFPFLYADYRDPSKPINNYWHGINYKGIVDYHRNRKLAWKTVWKAYNRCSDCSERLGTPSS